MSRSSGGHWGELLLSWVDRADSLSGVARLDRRLSVYVRANVHVTTSGMLSPVRLRHALAAVDDPADRERIAHGNATALFGLDAGLS
ncbi:MAG: hypothetical protein ABS81_32240 [Pseudonocardia sp. SCN 72-86]|nr:MAG: hypothetical protein ABS81_32240 [Pseudonocardia sp. SCN 72-86]